MKHLFIALFFFSLVRVSAQPTWADNVAPILYANCTKCHNPNGIAPFPLITYNDASTMSYYIGNAVGIGKMPPWPPDTTYQRYAHERILSASEKQTILDWVAAGAPSGNLANAPTPPVYTGAAEMLTPDVTLAMPTYTVASATDLYRCFVVPSGVPQNEYITEIEVVPGNRNIVHHVLIYQDLQNTCITLDNNDPGPGYTSFGGPGSNTANLIFGWVPGQGVYSLPPNMGIKLEANTNVIAQIHYPAGALGQTDSTKVLFKFSSGVVREVGLVAALNHFTNMTDGPLYIPADSIKTFHEQEASQLDATIISVAPHMHLLGKQIRSWAITPTNDTIPFIHVPNWNFMWQGSYTLRQLVHVPFGSQLYAEATFDNTAANTYNPNSPPQPVAAGESTTDEMMLVYFAYTQYQLGDENIITDSSAFTLLPELQNTIVQTAQLYDPYPSPANDRVSVSYFVPAKGKLKMELIDITGKIIAVPLDNETEAGFGSLPVALSDLPAGTYILRLVHNNTVRSKKIVVQR
ncbi:MAG: Copper type II ascorbate-dependent monooxygenase [Bacteroidetes bacterium]|nr:MAG: Copper type II ascorbate-dependent monooxygenase [Bacteroidota bacterium]